jgi:glycosyltransferase involved in cell wall biosynthesis
MTSKKKILILCPAPHGAMPSQRFRFEQYIPALEAHGFEVTQESFLDAETQAILHKPGHTKEKVRGVLFGFVRRVRMLARAPGYDYVFIHLEAAPIGPPVIEAALLALRRRLVYDIDDAIFLARTSKENRLISRFRWRSKVGWLARRSHKVTAVNPYLVEWAKQFNDEVFLIPTTIDPNYHRPAAVRLHKPRPMLGWTGSRSTMYFLDLIRPALGELAKTRDFTLRVVCDRDPGFPDLPHYEFVRWRQATEIEDLQPMDVGLMPVSDEEFSKGKVGFKAIQYSAMEIPPVVSGVGSGPEVVEHGKTGLVLPNTTEAWVQGLGGLLDDAELRQAMGRAARDKILKRYSVPAQTESYLGLFR